MKNIVYNFKFLYSKFKYFSAAIITIYFGALYSIFKFFDQTNTISLTFIEKKTKKL